MLSIPLTALRDSQANLRTNDTMQIGRQFMRLLRNEGITPISGRMHPIILGGAVRDTFFKNRTPNDIDIFFFRSETGGAMGSMERRNEAENLRQGVLAFLEDQEIDYTSLLSDRAAAYFGGQRFLDVIEIMWHDVRIQLMLPNADALHPLAQLLQTMPLYSAMGITNDRFICYNSTFASMFMPADTYPVGTDRDLPYIRGKFPQSNIIAFPSSDALVHIYLADQYPIHPVSETMNQSLASLRTQPATLVTRKACQWFNIEEGSQTGRSIYVTNLREYVITA